MIYKSKKELVENLLRRRFGSLAPPPVRTLHMASPRRENDNLILAPMNQVRLELEAMTMSQLVELVKTAEQNDLDALRAKEAAEEQQLFFNRADAGADLPHWAKMSVWTLDEAIALTLGKNPLLVNWDSVNGNGERYVLSALTRSPFPKEYARRHELVRRAVTVGELSDPIRPEAFLTWAQSTFDSLPAELTERVQARGKYIADMHALTMRVAYLEAQLVASGKATSKKWPWGTHETNLLLKLEGAANRFWVNYDPAIPSTANTNAVVTDWLKKQGVAERVAEIMAQILRADGLPKGPRT